MARKLRPDCNASRYSARKFQFESDFKFCNDPLFAWIIIRVTTEERISCLERIYYLILEISERLIYVREQWREMNTWILISSKNKEEIKGERAGLKRPRVKSRRCSTAMRLLRIDGRFILEPVPISRHYTGDDVRFIESVRVDMYRCYHNAWTWW